MQHAEARKFGFSLVRKMGDKRTKFGDGRTGAKKRGELKTEGKTAISRTWSPMNFVFVFDFCTNEACKQGICSYERTQISYIAYGDQNFHCQCNPDTANGRLPDENGKYFLGAGENLQWIRLFAQGNMEMTGISNICSLLLSSVAVCSVCVCPFRFIYFRKRMLKLAHSFMQGIAAKCGTRRCNNDEANMSIERRWSKTGERKCWRNAGIFHFLFRDDDQSVNSPGDGMKSRNIYGDFKRIDNNWPPASMWNVKKWSKTSNVCGTAVPSTDTEQPFIKRAERFLSTMLHVS